MYYEEIQAALFDEFVNQPDWHSIIKWINEHGYWFLINQLQKVKTKLYNLQELTDFKLRISSLTVSYEEKVSNSHHCPRNGVTNWYATLSLPTGYPGWRGTIEFEILPESANELVSVVHMLSNVGINLGSGGCNDKVHYTFDVTFFEEDWPGLINYRVLNTLSDEGTIWKRYNFDTIPLMIAKHYKR
jgi:hypothetical protein